MLKLADDKPLLEIFKVHKKANVRSYECLLKL